MARQLGTMDVPSNPDYRLGLATTSHAPEVYTTALFQLGELPAFTPPTIAMKDQLLLNGSFDSLTSWNRWGDSMNLQTNPTSTRTGAADIVCGPSSSPSGLWQDVRVTPGRQYTLSLWANHDKHLSPGTGSIELRLESTPTPITRLRSIPRHSPPTIYPMMANGYASASSPRQ